MRGFSVATVSNQTVLAVIAIAIPATGACSKNALVGQVIFGIVAIGNVVVVNATAIAAITGRIAASAVCAMPLTVKEGIVTTIVVNAVFGLITPVAALLDITGVAD